MIRVIGGTLLIIYMLVTALSVVLNFWTYRQEGRPMQLTGVLTILAALTTVFALFMTPDVAFQVAILDSIIIVGCAILNGWLSGEIHWSHHLVRVLILSVLLIMLKL